MTRRPRPLCTRPIFSRRSSERYRVIVSNPPYVPEAEVAELPPEYRHEPAIGLASGPTGFAHAERILRGARERLTPNGVLFLELGAGADAFAAAHPRAAADRARVRARRGRRARGDGRGNPGIPSYRAKRASLCTPARSATAAELDPRGEQGHMAGDTYGRMFTVTTFGESHGPALGCVVDGCPPGLALTEADIQKDLDRRRPGRSRHVTQRQEPDQVKILSGRVRRAHDGHRRSACSIENVDQRSGDYSKIKDSFRPGHADYTYQQKYGIRDYRGGGRSSARETAMRVAAGAIARKYLAEQLGVSIRGYLAEIGPFKLRAVDLEHVDDNRILQRGPGESAAARSRSWTSCAGQATRSARIN